jgi:hypothetical protein
MFASIGAHSEAIESPPWAKSNGSNGVNPLLPDEPHDVLACTPSARPAIMSYAFPHVQKH